MKRACFFGIYDPQHSRSKMIRGSLKKAGYDVTECVVNPRETKGILKYLELRKKFKSYNHKFDLIVVGFPGYFTLFLARLISTSPIILDSYISYFDGIRDRRNYSYFNPKLWFAWFVDFLDGIFSDVVLTINYAYRDFFIKSLRVSPRKMAVLHKGADEKIFFPRPRLVSNEGKFIIGWWGSFIPLHGVPVIIEAANLLKNRSEIEFRILGGRGQMKEAVEGLAAKYRLGNVKFLPFLESEIFLDEIEKMDIALGLFNPSPKSMRCVTNKVYEAMAMGKCIITQDSPANREIFTHKLNAYLVEPGNPQSLVKAINELIEDETLRKQLAQNAGTMFRERFVSAKIEIEFGEILKAHRLAL